MYMNVLFMDVLTQYEKQGSSFQLTKLAWSDARNIDLRGLM